MDPPGWAYGGGGVWRSTDVFDATNVEDVTWVPVTDRVSLTSDAQREGLLRVTSIAVDPSHPQIGNHRIERLLVAPDGAIYAATGLELFVRPPGAGAFVPLGSGQYTFTQTILPFQPYGRGTLGRNPRVRRVELGIPHEVAERWHRDVEILNPDCRRNRRRHADSGCDRLPGYFDDVEWTSVNGSLKIRVAGADRDFTRHDAPVQFAQALKLAG